MKGYKPRVRVRRWRIPDEPTICNLKGDCVYRKKGICDEPYINSENGDATCFKYPVKKILELLGIEIE